MLSIIHLLKSSKNSADSTSLPTFFYSMLCLQQSGLMNFPMIYGVF